MDYDNDDDNDDDDNDNDDDDDDDNDDDDDDDDAILFIVFLQYSAFLLITLAAQAAFVYFFLTSGNVVCITYYTLNGAGFRHVEAPAQPSAVELWRPTLP